jgi:translation elongation factor EF-G
MKAIIWDSDTLGATFQIKEIPADLVDKAKEYREKLIEKAVEMDDAAMEAYLNGKEPDIATLKRLHPQGHDRVQTRSDDVRLGVQEQGRSAHARRRR